ncbi:MAG TPA: NAD-dependent epimerase/dehydratase family protein [Polyangiaceae bacterium]|nr:NAD-dependent epimerase/dehydratase family protein [Polyangiaceae bacterium]
MRVLVIGGTGVIGTGIVRALAARNANVTVFSRGARKGVRLPGAVYVEGDRYDAGAFQRRFDGARYDVVVDLMCFSSTDAESTVRAFGGKCEQLLFCSTVCVYGDQTPPSVLVSEDATPEPSTPYGRDKLECERLLLEAARTGRFAVTVVRPSHTYAPGGPMLDQLEIEGVAWDRAERGLPVLCSGDGLGLWQSTHADDVGKLFAHAAGNPRTYGEIYNATRDEVTTWREYHREVARALGGTARLVLAPAAWLLQEMPERLAFLRETSRFHGAYSSAKAKAHVPEFRATIPLVDGARETLTSLKARGKLRSSSGDHEYERTVARATAMGFETVVA